VAVAAVVPFAVGCGFRSNAAPDDSSAPGQLIDAAAVTDASIASTVDAGNDAATPIATCLMQWMAGTVQLTPPALINVSSTGTERDPWISKDGMRLYYAETPAGGHADIMVATLMDAAKMTFGAGQPLGGVNSTNANDDDGRPALMPDEKTIVMTSDRGAGGDFDVYMATRAQISDPFGTPTTNHLTNIDNQAGDHLDPFITSDGLRLYTAPTMPNHQHIVVSTRGKVGDDFGNPATVNGISNNNTDADPAVSADDQIIVFTSQNRAGNVGGTDLYYAVRPTPTQDFANPKLIPTVNSASDDGDPMLSTDGCSLFFSSKRPGGSGDYDLYVSTVTVQAQPM
jgi:Tol biopolymer transport system component